MCKARPENLLFLLILDQCQVILEMLTYKQFTPEDCWFRFHLFRLSPHDVYPIRLDIPTVSRHITSVLRSIAAIQLYDRNNFFHKHSKINRTFACKIFSKFFSFIFFSLISNQPIMNQFHLYVSTIGCDMLYIFNDKTRWLRHTKIMTLHQMVSRRLLNYIWARSYATLFLNFSTFLPSFLNLHILILSKLTELLIRPH